MKQENRFQPITVILAALLFSIALVAAARAQQKDMPEVTIATAVSNLAFGALWVAEQLKYFEQEGVRAKITSAGGGSTCQSAVVGRSVNFCASSSEGLVLAYVEGAPLVAMQAHNRALTLSLAVRKAIADKFKLTRKSPLSARLKVLSQLGPIGATSPGAVSEQIFKFLVTKAGGDASKLKFVYLGGPQMPPSLMNNVIDAFALSPPSAEITEAAGKGYVLIPLGLGEVPELTDYPYEVLMARPDYVENNRQIATAVARAISRGGALFHSNPEAAKSALRAHKFSDSSKLDQKVFDLSFETVKPAMPRWGNMDAAGWKKVISFSTGAGIVKDPSKAPTAEEGLLWTNKFVGKAP
jgi:NitT/TauT family transport system substrate-binding protein